MQAQENQPFHTFVNANCLVGLESNLSTEVLPAKYAAIEIEAIGKDWLFHAQKNGQTEHFLYVNKNLIPLPFASVQKLNEQLIKVGQNGQFGVVNTKGEGVALIQYQQINPAGEVGVIVKIKDKWGIIAYDGRQLLPNLYDEIRFWPTGMFWAKTQGKWQLYDKQGSAIEDALYDAVAFSFAAHDYCAIQRETGWQIIDTQNKQLFDSTFQKVNILDNGLIAAEGKKGWFFLDKAGNILHENFFVNYIETPFGLIEVEKKDQWGVLATDGKEILPCKYTQVISLNANTFALRSQKESHQIYHNNKWQEGEWLEVLPFGESKIGFWGKQEDGWTLLNFEGKPITEDKYKSVRILDGYDYAIIENEERKLGVITYEGKVQINPQYDVLIPFRTFFKARQKEGKWFYLDRQNRKLNCSPK